jgi:hypothetical protein
MRGNDAGPFRKLLLYPPELRGRKDLHRTRLGFYHCMPIHVPNRFRLGSLRWHLDRREAFEPIGRLPARVRRSRLPHPDAV